MKILLVLPVSSAHCERSISSINRIKSDVRNCLSTSTVNSLVRISAEGQSIESFQTKPCIVRWFSKPRKVVYDGWPEDDALVDVDSDDHFK